MVVPRRAQKADEAFYRLRGHHLPRRDADTIARASDRQLEAFGIPHDKDNN